MRALMVELDRLRELSDEPHALPRVAARRFQELVATGERLLARLGEKRAA
jgi:hypothetical protein